MFNNHPGVLSEKVVDRDIIEQRLKFMYEAVRWVGKRNVIWTTPLVWPTEELFHCLRTNGQFPGHPAFRYIPTQELQRSPAGFDTRHMSGPSTQCFDANRPRSRIEIQKTTERKPITKN
jgi:hypothetical protein